MQPEDAEMETTATLLVVDDEENILSSLVRLFSDEDGFDVIAKSSATDALAVLEDRPVDIIISDMRMPIMDGATFLAQAAQRWPDTARMLLTGFSDMESTVRAINEGHISHYISKPWDDDDLVDKVKNALELKRLREQNKVLLQIKEQQRAELQALTENQEAIIRSRTEELQQTASQLDVAYQELQESYYQSIPLLSNLVEMNERHKKNHAARVANIAKIIGEEMQLPDREMRQLFIGALLHDIGKLGLEQSIRGKSTDSMSPLERKRYQQHAILGESALLSFDPLRDAAQIVRSHHERFDGKGFPGKLSGSDIPLGARIVAVANDYDNILLPNNFLGKNLNDMQAHEFIIQESGKRYDPQVVSAFDAVIDKVRLLLAKDREALLPLDKIEPGMTLSQDLINQHGMVMLVAGRVLTEAHIKKLQQFERAFDTKLMISIKQPPSPVE
ncbi:MULTISPECIES: HD domain-containing phosphohydrolase [unclassified Ketobacter]|uniref:HD domain-containing phosphohydrolase n=1 Tax=unclassified Ketobacter TaxID=2639109 RepID=UPI000F1E564F|nr:MULTISPECIES: HD domain-containing phosphohydrolase [unclassified Ketobacter]RLT90696.1 MAG: response regulator [Ketobacter sp. GenoA1]RLT99794.1 MAG: response regulator [Ketobacter sp.]